MRARVFLEGVPASSSGVGVTTIDVSMTGICIATDLPVETGAHFDVELHLERGNAVNDPLMLPARAVWTTTVGDQRQVGATFRAEISALSLARLDVMMKFLRGELELSPRR